jgi:transglutaminase-like putative cysteine protease
VVDFSHPFIQSTVFDLLADSQDEIQIVQTAFEYVRDSIAHAFDINSTRVTCKASEVLSLKHGICYAKSNLLAAILRCKGIPAGFCYQLLTKGDTPDTGYCIHALNAVYLKTLQRWIRLDARGNKEGVDARFSIDKEYLAFPVRKQFNEMDYPIIYTRPNANTIDALRKSTDCQALMLNLPVQL